MSSRSQNDTVIDDDEELCPLCIEEFDLSDKNFKPCPCGYQICQFCYNNIKTHSEEGRCPNCRRAYDESTIQYRVPDVDEFKADLALKHRKAAAAKRKEAERREIEASSRKNLAGVRVVQKNLVYVIGLNPTIRDESQLLQTLRGEQYFGQYGDIEKIVVSKAKPGGNPNQGIGVYVTFARKNDAATCIAAVDGSPNGDRVLRAQYGTTKYCSSFLRNEPCNNRNCTFLHETGNDSDSFSRQDLSSMNTLSSQRFHPNSQPNTQPSPPTNQLPYQQLLSSRPHPQPTIAGPSGSQPSKLHNGKDDIGTRIPNSDSSALPSSASWANRDPLTHRTRRPSVTATHSSPSPKPANEPSGSKSESRDGKGAQESQAPTTQNASSSDGRDMTSESAQASTSPTKAAALDKLVKAVNSPEFRFQFSSSGLPADDLIFIENHPSLIDPYGGVKRRAMREKAEQERVKQDAEAKLLLQPMMPEEENLESGSSQLGGEPEHSHVQANTSGRHAREAQAAIQPPSQQVTANNSAIASPVSAGQQFQGLSANGRNLTHQQQQQLLLLKSAGGQQPGSVDPSNAASGAFDQNTRAGAFQNQMPPMTSMPGHARQSSRFSFANDLTAKTSNQRLFGQQAAMMQSSSPNPLSSPTAQQGLGNQFFVSGIQGPPPGLKTAGTPPVSGGGMFAQGHGFTSTMNNNLGIAGKQQDGNADLMRELMRARSGASGASQGHEPTKREFLFPFLQQHNTPPPPLAPVSGLLNSLYGQQPGLYQEPVPQKQKKRGKKHRHANTSSGGGGVVDLADPSILQARMHHSSANAAPGQGLYGSQGQADEDFPPLAPASKPNYENQSPDILRLPNRSVVTSESPVPSSRTGTPAAPPGLPLPHAHPTASFGRDSSNVSSPSQLKTPLSNVPHIPPPPGLIHPQSLRESTATADSNQGSPTTLSRSREASRTDISFGSPKQKIAKPDQNASAPAATKSRQSSQVATGKPKSLKLDMSFHGKPRESPPSHVSTPNQAAAILAPSSAVSSRPNTPAIGNSRASDSPAPRQPRVLRVVDTPKPETPLQTTASVANTLNVNSKQKSRRPSHSSTSHPTTPAEAGSEYDPYTSASVSRANSPPPSRIGSAPVRAMTKNQMKKDRKLKAKQAEAKKEEQLLSTAVAEEHVQAPIIGRKRKTKKPPKPTGDTGVDVSDIDSKVPTSTSGDRSRAETPITASPMKSMAASEKPSGTKTKPQKKEPEEPWRSNNTLEQLTIDSESVHVPVKDLFLERSAPLPTLLGQLHQSGDLDLNTHPLFNAQNLGQRMDMKCTSDDYESLKKPIELNEEDRKQLLRGEPIFIGSDNDTLKHRCLITPSGCILRHLSTEEEDTYLALEKSLTSVLENLQEYPSLVITEPDVTNRGGGLDALFATPEKFNIRWIDDESPPGALVSSTSDGSAILSPPSTGHASAPSAPNVFSALEADTARSHNWAITNGSETLQAATPVRSSTAKNLGSAMAAGLEELASMPDEELRAMIDNAQRELETSRKEVDVVDKKVGSLVKRNKKLVQQALLAALESITPTSI